ncbi:nuclear transcription factor, X-box binding protein, putative [Pediculus humanus corporis]|uniref:Nuclear transcription factor, X-box binding protein, putative n=1 Tax=Pediculus humanus subsp. corporis TaxID=121224 RepID=E0VZX8_PEDHC|nr:nuclear transcription factor, X-box binding protein, putative [Pediculus humanus corporis]EEB18933.1 nuclear transcription factor, X-box binding protein, putative [Pediculus humanus corporis]
MNGDKNVWNKSQNPWKNKNSVANNKNTAEIKFKNAQEKLQASVNKHLEQQEYESSSDEEPLESESILSSVFKNYDQFNDKHEGVERTQQFLENAFQSGAGICLICIGSIKRADTIWNCLECYSCFHLICIVKWANDSIHQQKLTQEDLPAFRKTQILWACPKCRHDYKPESVPQKSYCFCGKVEDPEFHPWLIPHSCGETCGKKLKPECGHSCLLLCHPGPCPPCPKTVQAKCHCGKKGPKHSRCSNKLWSCNSKCSKPLLCKKHNCDQICHSGDCPPCNRESSQKCQCGLQERKQPCLTPNWQCEKVCGKPLSCGFHKCLIRCHSGPCGCCPSSLERTCPCGKTNHLLPCTVDVPTCNETCDKILDCGIHKCPQKCHKDKCGMCLVIEKKQCRCGLHKKELPCQKSFTCETKCKRIKNCLKHACNRKCCDMNCLPCEKPCGKTLKCGYHKCPLVCHKGQCYPCPEVAHVKCRCGKTSITVPCGRQKKTCPPKCNKKCSIPPTCHHPSREPHSCHFGECPPCKQICNKTRSNCDHLCPAPCHSAVWVKIEDNHRPAGPWEISEPKQKKCKLPCPDCQAPVSVTCLGGHETCDWPCYKAKPSSCHRPCGRLLKCTNHTCQKPCHVVSGAGDSFFADESCLECESECLKVRPPGCSHKCPKPCHSGPCPPCTQNIKSKCHCGVLMLINKCSELNSVQDDVKDKLLSCGNKCPKNYPCGHKCKSDCHVGDCPDPDSCRKKVKKSCKCGKVKKEITCDMARACKKEFLDCDETCLIKSIQEKREKELETEKRKLEEEKRSLNEYEKFQNKFRTGRKGKQKKKMVEEEKPSFASKYWIFILSAFFGTIVTIIYLMQ